MNDLAGLSRLLSHQVLSRHNSDRLIRVFYDAAKIVAIRQNRTNKKQLKMKEICSALTLADFVNSRQFHCEASGTLAECFGPFEEDSAVAYYGTKVMGSVQDKFGRTVSQGMEFLRRGMLSDQTVDGVDSQRESSHKTAEDVHNHQRVP